MNCLEEVNKYTGRHHIQVERIWIYLIEAAVHLSNVYMSILFHNKAVNDAHCKRHVGVKREMCSGTFLLFSNQKCP